METLSSYEKIGIIVFICIAILLGTLMPILAISLLFISFIIGVISHSPDTTEILSPIEDYSRVPDQYYLTYRAYLRSAEWRALRTEALHRDQYECTVCETPNDLQVHHLHYKGIETMTFNVDQLKTLCETCHSRVHDLQDRIRNNNTDES